MVPSVEWAPEASLWYVRSTYSLNGSTSFGYLLLFEIAGAWHSTPTGILRKGPDARRRGISRPLVDAPGIERSARERL